VTRRFAGFRLTPPLGGITDRYLLKLFARNFLGTLLFVTILYLVVDIFDLLDNLMGKGASLGTSLRYFLYKLPLIISRVFGFASLFATFLTLGTLAREREVVALRSCGVSLYRIALPFIMASILISLTTFFWNESVVPLFTRQSEYVYNAEVEKTKLRSVFGRKAIWMRSSGAFIRADNFDSGSDRLYGLVIYRMNQDFTLGGLVESPVAHWDGKHWVAQQGTEWSFKENGAITQQPANGRLPLRETPEDFKVFQQTPEEFSFFALRSRIGDLRSKGINTTEHEVDLQMKLALAVISPLMVLLAIPFCINHGRRSGLALSFALTMLIGFAYWVLLGFCVSLGKAGALEPWLAAWLPNMIVGFVGLYFFSGQE